METIMTKVVMTILIFICAIGFTYLTRDPYTEKIDYRVLASAIIAASVLSHLIIQGVEYIGGKYE